MKKLTLEEFKVTVKKMKKELDDHFIDYLYETMENFNFKTEEGAEMSKFIWLETHAPETNKEWNRCYEFYEQSTKEEMEDER